MKKKKHSYNKKKSSTLMMLKGMMRNLKEYLITLVLFQWSKSQSIQVRDIGCGGVRTTISTRGYVWKQSRINVEEENRKGVQKREVPDSLQSIQLKILDLDTNLEGHQNLSSITIPKWIDGYGMDRIINWLILIIIFVFDPPKV